MTFNDSFVDFCNEIRKNFEARRYHREKERFIKKLQERYPFKVDHHGTCNNLILGDIDTASLVFTAHYDTAVVSLTPNANCYFDRKIGKRMRLYAILPAFVPFVVFLLIYFYCVFTGNQNSPIVLMAFLALFPIEARIFGLFGRANPHTQNDNTSGVIAVLALVEKLKTRGDVAFVLFDNEELGLWGSRFLHKNFPDAHIINMDCVSDGTVFLISINNGFARLYESVLKEFDPSDGTRRFIICSPEKDDKVPEWIKFKQIKLASDHRHFINGAGIAAVDDSGCIFRLHTPQDTVFDWENIEFLSNALVDFTQIALKRK